MGSAAMALDWQTCSRARLSRDARFDGKFFIAVLTSRIYCRPICPARASKEKNVRYYPTAAAAAEAGFRPCLRCRPECSPGTPAWLGTPVTVSRALRLIDESGLEDGGLDQLAERLGMSARHLRRLFLRHLGATPSAVARTRRLHFAKKLITETKLPMNQIALATGFGCVRRFNAGIRAVYHRTPSQIRRLARQTNPQPGNQYVFQLGFRPPYDWHGMLAFLGAHATPGVEVVSAGRYCRSISLRGGNGYFEVTPGPESHSLAVRVEFDSPRLLFLIVERIRSMFDLNADWEAISRGLRTDPALRRCVDAHPGLRVPGCWNGFELATRAILDRQTKPQVASRLAGRLVQAFGRPYPVGRGLSHLFPGPETLANADLARIGVGPKRAACLRALARAVSTGRICFEGIVDSQDFRVRLCELEGLHGSTADYVVMRALREPDAFPSGDRSLTRASLLADSRELEARAEAWRPWRAYAAMYLWTFPMSRSRNGRTPGREQHPARPVCQPSLHGTTPQGTDFSG